MRNVVKLIVLHVLILLVALQRSEAKVAPICGDHEDVAPPKDFEEKPHCWTLLAEPLEGTCDCGIAYVPDTFGRCTSCSDGFKRNDKNECVHCPNRNERWCSKKKKCICIQNFHRNETKSCVPCDEFEESNGFSKCKCAHGYTRRHEDDSVEGSCVLAPNSYGTKRIILAIVSISFLGSTIGYAIKKHGSRLFSCMNK